MKQVIIEAEKIKNLESFYDEIELKLTRLKENKNIELVLR